MSPPVSLTVHMQKSNSMKAEQLYPEFVRFLLILALKKKKVFSSILLVKKSTLNLTKWDLHDIVGCENP